MEDQAKLMEALLERGTEYARQSFELAKLKAVDKTSEVVSSLFPRVVVVIMLLLFALFVSLGLALWLGLILGNMYYGFFLVAGFYGLAGIVVYFFMHNWLKKIVSDNFIRQVLK